MQNQVGGFDYRPTIRVLFGANLIDRLGEYARQLGGKAVLVVSDPGLIAAGHVQRAQHALEAQGLRPVLFTDVAENPTSEHVARGVEFAQQQEPIDLIVAIGGGSALDCAKGINFVLTNGGRMEDYWGFGKAAQPMLPAIGLPTTAGTGSEAQSFALISHAKTHEKMACGDVKARFNTVILDPVLATSAPPTVIAVTGIDAVSHAVESFVSTKSNPISKMFAQEAWRLLDRNFEKTLSDRSDVEAQGEMLLAAHLAGQAIENSMLGAAHACANPLTAKYGITHGIAVGLMLPAVIRFNSETVADEYAQLARVAGLASGFELHDRVLQLREKARLPANLRSLQVKSEDLPELAEAAAKQWTGTFNPRTVTKDDFLSLYEETY